MRIDDARLAGEGGAYGQAVSTVNMEITGRRESQRSEEEIWATRRGERESHRRGRGKKKQEINKEGWRSGVFSVQAVNRVLIDPETEAIIPVQQTQQLQA